MRESRFQSKVITFLKQKGAYVLNTTPTPGIPTGCPDVIGLLDGGGWVGLEVKATNPYRRDGVAKKGAFQPLQQETVKKLNGMYFARVVYPENWDEVKRELLEIV